MIQLWVNAGELHLIPLESSQDIEGRMSLATALSIMFNSHKRISTLASPSISKAIWLRTSSTFNAVKTEHAHRTVAYLPDEVIRILEYDPSLISKAVATFYERDAIQLKVSCIPAISVESTIIWLILLLGIRHANTCAVSDQHQRITLQSA